MFDEIMAKIETAIVVLVGLIKAGHPLCGTASGSSALNTAVSTDTGPDLVG
ncbi:MAG TPA: hypothetical protein VF573_14565 [Paraburkholderia sp.]|uniref:hypothetical protein n=1 Tax=Paraburkholderia sp. TaxID=1926495 RepID=UPI002ED3A5AB